MSRRDDEVRLLHMLDHAQEAVEMCRGRARQDLGSDRMLNLAMVRLVEVVGEAANRVSKSTQELHSEIAWREIISMRNRIIHGYDTVDFDILWAVIQDDLPTLVEQPQKALGQV